MSAKFVNIKQFLIINSSMSNEKKNKKQNLFKMKFEKNKKQRRRYTALRLYNVFSQIIWVCGHDLKYDHVISNKLKTLTNFKKRHLRFYSNMSAVLKLSSKTTSFY